MLRSKAMIEIKTWGYDQSTHRDIAQVVGLVDFNAKAYGSTEAAAKAFHLALSNFCKSKITTDQRRFPKLLTPEESSVRYRANIWMVSWEDGPFEWAVFLCMDDGMNGLWGYCEPQNSFVVCFVEM